MSHELEQFDGGIVSFVVSRRPGWHQLGEVLPAEFTLKEGMVKSTLNWSVAKEPATVVLPNGSTQLMPGQYMIVRDHPIKGLEAISFVGKRYQAIQNADAFGFGDNLVDEGGAHWESMGSLKGGKVVFAAMLLPDHMTSDIGDGLVPRLLLMNTHDGSGCMKASIVVERTVCNNTLRMNLANAKHTWRIKHTRSALDRIEEARRALGLSFAYLDEFQAEVNALMDIGFTDGDFEKLVQDLMPMPVKVESKETELHIERERQELLHLWKAPTQADYSGTGWAAYNAVTEYADWFAPIRAKDHTARRAEAAIMGDNEAIKHQAHTLIKLAA